MSPHLYDSYPSMSEVDDTGVQSCTKTELLESIQETIDRKNNVVFYNVNESTSNLKNERLEHDKKEIIAVANQIEINLNAGDIKICKYYCTF